MDWVDSFWERASKIITHIGDIPPVVLEFPRIPDIREYAANIRENVRSYSPKIHEK